MLKTFVVFRSHGAGWVEGAPTRHQPLWDEHAAFMDRLFDSGSILLAGPYADDSAALLLLRAEDEASALAMLRHDPWTTHVILEAGLAKEWTIFLDSREKQSG